MNSPVSSLELHPNTGHQYHFIEFAPPDAPKSERRSQLSVPKEVFEAAEKDDTPWESQINRPWLLFKIGTSSGKPGLMIVIETNLGSRGRGTPVEPFVKHEPTDIPHDSRWTPYAFNSLDALQSESNDHDRFKISIASLLKQCIYCSLDSELGYLELRWKVANADKPRDVDLVVDFGNSRTIALLVEEPGQGIEFERFSDICHPVRFIGRGSSYEPHRQIDGSDKLAILDSWLLLRQAHFDGVSSLENKDYQFEEVAVPTFKRLFSRYKSIRKLTATRIVRGHRFVEISPAVISADSSDSPGYLLGQLDFSRGGNLFLSSPKRYVWDNRPLSNAEEFWNMICNRWSKDSMDGAVIELPLLGGDIRRLMDADGQHWSFDEPTDQNIPHRQPPPYRPLDQRPSAKDNPIYPRSDALVWMALGLLERAYAQLNSPAHVNAAGSAFVPRRLRRIQVTFPSGWTSTELRTYRANWQKAIDIFALSRFESPQISTSLGGNRPVLATEFDEAVASQLPLVVANIQMLGGNAHAWLELCGRPSQSNRSPVVRVLNLDIGGGTTDVSVVEYGESSERLVGGVSLRASSLLKFSSNFAGDVMAKRIIERVLLPRIAEGCSDVAALKDFFGDPPPHIASRVSGLIAEKARIVRLVLLPIVHYWLGRLNQTITSEVSDTIDPPYDQGNWNKLIEMIKLTTGLMLPLQAHNAWKFDDLGKSGPKPGKTWLTLLDTCIIDTFDEILPVVSAQVAAYGVDLILISGKPSELPPLRKRILELMPLPMESIHFAKDYPTGPWYPYGNRDRISDAKTVTAVGAALYQVFQTGGIKGWRIEVKPSKEFSNRNDWGVIDRRTLDDPRRFAQQIILRAEEDTITAKVLMGSRIGCRRPFCSNLPPDCVYELVWKNKNVAEANQEVEIVVRRLISESANTSEELLLESATGVGVSTEDVELRLNTLAPGGFWMDNPRFEFICTGS